MHLDDEIASDDRFWPVNGTSRVWNQLARVLPDNSEIPGASVTSLFSRQIIS